MSALLAGCRFPLVDGGHATLAYRLLGDTGPVVVFESGQGLGKESWDRVAPLLAACARVVVYDRAGIGDSVASPRGQTVTAAAVAGALAGLLRAIGVSPPYILVGHSLGGLADVAAVLLVDASSPLEPPGTFVSTARLEPGSVAAFSMRRD